MFGAIFFCIKRDVQAVPGLVSYLKTLLPKLIVPLTLQKLDLTIQILHNDPVVGDTLNQIAKAAIESYKKEKDLNAAL
jgi:hypothetical protein